MAALIASEKPDVVLVELDAERLQLLWGGDRDVYGGELAEAVRAARAADAPVVRGGADASTLWFLDARRGVKQLSVLSSRALCTCLE